MNNKVTYYSITRVDIDTGEILQKSDINNYNYIGKELTETKYYKDVNGHTRSTRYYWQYGYRRKPQLTLF